MKRYPWQLFYYWRGSIFEFLLQLKRRLLLLCGGVGVGGGLGRTECKGGE